MELVVVASIFGLVVVEPVVVVSVVLVVDGVGGVPNVTKETF